ncbi:MAG TPA: N-acetyltransferase [Herpetosiphon sp.]|uniref:GCN5-related N-acetyltransferase n=1 Tax=Herpetosiphon aurantiacus (strain ATCC 23779 / DSM 785 / 114-95) TaxID=316274 RepID=A9B0W3_HERA2|nr:GNAT family N-acetyltransferase [Herpetosiphon sp.]ABX03833.1 GCN5-related N-acetyltransferase [Herpetosiphon aurantiacus DSM 785]HBW53147.1 N-acetyltransferase [Herpetosiphon sp.]
MQLSTERGDLTLRAAQTDEWQAYRRLRLMALQQHPSFFGSDYAQNAAEPDRYWQERMANLDPTKQQTFVAVHESQFVAMVGIRRFTDPKSSHQADIWGVYTDPNWRGNGLSRQLLGMAEAWAWQQSVQIIRLAVNVANTSAIQLYTRCGYAVYGVEPMAIYYEGIYHDELLMTKKNIQHRTDLD